MFQGGVWQGGLRGVCVCAGGGMLAPTLAAGGQVLLLAGPVLGVQVPKHWAASEGGRRVPPRRIRLAGGMIGTGCEG